jgi:hypothetical protein
MPTMFDVRDQEPVRTVLARCELATPLEPHVILAVVGRLGAAKSNALALGSVEKDAAAAAIRPVTERRWRRRIPAAPSTLARTLV